MIGLVGYMVSHLVNGAAQNMAMLFAARIMGGVLSSATLPTSLALVSDVTDEQDRGGGMGIMGAAMGMGVIFGPSVGGLLSHYTNSYRAPFFVAAGLVAILIPLAQTFLRETLPDHERDHHRRVHAENGAATFADRLRDIGQALKGNLAFYFVLTFLVSFAVANLEGIFSFFAMDRFGYGTREIGVMFTVM
jgi:MFS family permease